jgi:hypothetical protein
MSSFEIVYLCFSVGAFVFFGVALAGAVAYSNAKPQERSAPSRTSAHA